MIKLRAERRDQMDEERNRLILENYLRAWNTQEEIGRQFNLDRSTVTKVLNDVKNLQMQEIHKDYKDYIVIPITLSKIACRNNNGNPIPIPGLAGRAGPGNITRGGA